MTTKRELRHGEEIIPDLFIHFRDDPNRDWMKRAACRGMDTSMWFPEKGDTRPYNKAMQICNTCLVRPECAEYGAYERYGIWGGMNLKQRQSTRKEPANA